MRVALGRSSQCVREVGTMFRVALKNMLLMWEAYFGKLT